MTTKHGKQAQAALPLRLGLGARLIVAEDVDTDLLGTFTGEVPREGTPREVALRKARLGMAADLPLGMASEGSFGPDPMVPFITIHHELLVFVDDERNIEVCEQVATARTNFAHTVVARVDELGRFLERVGFPAHALIVRPHSAAAPHRIWKGLRAMPELDNAIQAAVRDSDDGFAQVETDMRAHLNPARAKVIRRLAFKLVLRLRQQCPACDAPGWGRIDVEPGLPCRWCDTPTELMLREVYACAVCDHQERRRRSDGLEAADPGQCARCNP